MFHPILRKFVNLFVVVSHGVARRKLPDVSFYLGLGPERVLGLGCRAPSGTGVRGVGLTFRRSLHLFSTPGSAAAVVVVRRR